MIRGLTHMSEMTDSSGPEPPEPVTGSADGRAATAGATAASDAARSRLTAAVKVGPRLP